MGAIPEQSSSAAAIAPSEPDPARAPLCFVIDGDISIRHFLSLILHGAGIDTEEFADGQGLRRALSRRAPDVIFLDIPLESAEAIACVVALGNGNYRGRVQLMSSRGSAVLAHVQSIGEQQKLQMLPVLRKAVRHQRDHQAAARPQAGPSSGRCRTHRPCRCCLGERMDRILVSAQDRPAQKAIGRRRSLRPRPPFDTWRLLPSAFMPGAREAELIALSELALSMALAVAANFGKLGVNLRMVVYIPVPALVKLDVAAIMQTYRPQFEKWPGLTIDVSEVQIVTDLALANDFTKRLQHLNVQLAIDDFGRGYSSLVRLKICRFRSSDSTVPS
jgi:CheY-like chemotaxis protein